MSLLVPSPQVEPRHRQHNAQHDVQWPKRDASGGWFRDFLFGDVDLLRRDLLRNVQASFGIAFNLRLPGHELWASQQQRDGPCRAKEIDPVPGRVGNRFVWRSRLSVHCVRIVPH